MDSAPWVILPPVLPALSWSLPKIGTSAVSGWFPNIFKKLNLQKCHSKFVLFQHESVVIRIGELFGHFAISTITHYDKHRLEGIGIILPILSILVQLSRQFGCSLNRSALFACFK
jgi:hypothetical protein